MTANDVGPHLGSEAKARENELDGSTSENNTAADANQAQLIRTIKAHLDKGDHASEKAEQHYITAGRHLKTLRDNHTGTWVEWVTLLKTEIGIGKSRASELMEIADGRKTAEGIAAARRKRQLKARIARNSVDDGEIGATLCTFSDGKQRYGELLAPSKRQQASARPKYQPCKLTPSGMEELANKLIALDCDIAGDVFRALAERRYGLCLKRALARKLGLDNDEGQS
jgi:hypothetical protein